MAKEKKAAKPKPKKRAGKYEDKLQINGSFEDIVKALVKPKQPTKKK
jgi:hypothetical protein